ncbi:MAG: hypothetical protein HYX83_00125 [Chloroflexi bacterium]|nr:hypothetical protein [Chloroflexota bacterium]
MTIKMKVLDYPMLVRLNESSISAGRKQNLKPEHLPENTERRYIVNFHFDHEWTSGRDVRMSVILKPAIQTVWLDVSPEEYQAISEAEMTELEWEAAVCVGTPRWAP